MATIEALEDIKELNARHADIKIEQMLAQKREEEKQYVLMKKQMEEEEDEAEIRYVYRTLIHTKSNVVLPPFSRRKVFGKPLPKSDPEDEEDENEEVDNKAEEIVPLSLNPTKPKVCPLPMISQQF